MPRYTSIGALIAAFMLAFSVVATAASESLTQETTSYKMALHIGAVEVMLMPDQAKGATDGEVMAPMPGMAMPQMPMMDQGQPVNRHLEVQIVQKADGKILADQLPTITITDQKTGASHALASVMGMYGATAGPGDLHFGHNIFLADGVYTVTVKVGAETATFKDVIVGSAVKTVAATTSPSATAALPKTGGPPFQSVALALGVALVAAGAFHRRR